MLKGENRVKLVGYLKYPKFRTLDSGSSRFEARLNVPIEVTRGGTSEIVQIPYNIGAWGNMADALGSLMEGTPLEVTGQLNVRSYNSPCKSCRVPDKKYWTEVNVHNFMPIVEEG